MVDRPIRIRRARRTDFAAVMGLLAGANRPVPAPERASLHRFRQLVADLGTDLYLATIDERMVGAVHVTYARQLTTAPLATIAQLVTDETAGAHRIEAALLAFVRVRVHKRACAALRYGACEGDGITPAAWGQRLAARTIGTLIDVPLNSEG